MPIATEGREPLVSLTSQLEACRARTRNQGFSILAHFHAISSERSCFKRMVGFIYFFVTPKPLVSLTSQLEACSARLRVNRQTDRQTNQVPHASRVNKLLLVLCMHLKLCTHV